MNSFEKSQAQKILSMYNNTENNIEKAKPEGSLSPDGKKIKKNGEWVVNKKNKKEIPYTSPEYLVGKKINAYGKGIVEVIGYGTKSDMYKIIGEKVPSNPMGYSEERGTYYAVKNEDGILDVLNPSFGNKARIALSKEVNPNNSSKYKNIKDVSILTIDQDVLFKTDNGGFIEGKVIDHFGDGVMLSFSSNISNYGKSFDVFNDDDVVNNIYIK